MYARPSGPTMTSGGGQAGRRQRAGAGQGQRCEARERALVCTAAWLLQVRGAGAGGATGISDLLFLACVPKKQAAARRKLSRPGTRAHRPRQEELTIG